MTPYFSRAVVCGTVFFLATGASAQTESGYTFGVSVQSLGDKGKNGKPLMLKASVAGRNGRVDVIQGDDEYKTGDFVITNDGGETFWAVSPKKKQAERMSPETVRKLIRKEDFAVKNVSLSPPAPTGTGETVVGIAAKSFRYSRNYMITASVLFFSSKINVAETWDFQVAPPSASVPAFNPAVSYLALTKSAILFKNDAYATTGYKAMLPAGFAVKVVTEAGATIGKKREREGSVITCDVIVPAPLDASLFRVPNGFKRRE